jgi:hypothetical protein
MKKILVALVMTLLVSEVNALGSEQKQIDAITVYGNLVTQRGMLKNAPPALKAAFAPMIPMTEKVLKDLCKGWLYTGRRTSQRTVMESVKACYLGVGINKCGKVKGGRHDPYAGSWCRKQGL